MKLVEVISDAGSVDTVSAIAGKHKAHDFRLAHKGEDGRQAMRILVADDRLQGILDDLQTILGTQSSAHIIVIPVEVALPRESEKEREEEDAATATREALYETVEKNALFDVNYIALVVLSTLVAAIGLIADNVAVIVGAMVIAPLLGPNLALGLGTALGDLQLMRKALRTNIAGIAIAITLSYAIGLLVPLENPGSELLSRTDVGMDSIVLALASGAAASLSLTTGLPSILVGVMVAVALLPPSSTLGLMLAHGRPDLATGAGLLLAINVVCLNLAAKLVFLFKGIRPRTWWEKEKAKRALIIYLAIWLITLLLLVTAALMRRALAVS